MSMSTKRFERIDDSPREIALALLSVGDCYISKPPANFTEEDHGQIFMIVGEPDDADRVPVVRLSTGEKVHSFTFAKRYPIDLSVEWSYRK